MTDWLHTWTSKYFTFEEAHLSTSDNTQHLHAKRKRNAVIWNQLTITANKQIGCSRNPRLILISSDSYEVSYSFPYL